MKSSEKNKVNFGIVEWFKGTKLGKWLVKVKLFFIRSVAHSKRSEDIIISYKSGRVYYKDTDLGQEYSIPYDWFKEMFIEYMKNTKTYTVNDDLNKSITSNSNSGGSLS